MRFRVEPASRGIQGAARVPGDKSIGHRAVMFAALGEGRSRVSGLSGGEDNQRTVEAFRRLGVALRDIGDRALEVEGVGLMGLRQAEGAIDCGNSGTSMRLLSGLFAGLPFRTTLDGDEYLRLRPMARVARPLGEMGAKIVGREGKKPGEVYAPLEIAGHRPLGGIDYTSPVASAQVKSALLLAGLSSSAVVRVREPGPSRDHTERMLSALGVPITVPGPGEVVLDPRGWSGKLAPRDWQVPGDPSSAAFPLVAALLVPGSEVTVRGVCVNPTRTGLLDAVRSMGGTIVLGNERVEGGEPIADVTARSSVLLGADLHGELIVRAIDEVPILAVAATQAQGRTTIRDAAELRVKESDRIAETRRVLVALGGNVRELEDGLEIEGPTPLHGGIECDSVADHRIAMACAVAGLVAKEAVQVLDVGNVATSFPGFAELMRKLGAGIQEVEE